MPELNITCTNSVASRASGIESVRCLFPDRHISVRDLIALAVREQCRQLELRHADDLDEVPARLTRQYLSEAEMKDQAANGRVVVAERPTSSTTRVNQETEIAKALRGFSSGAFLILVGDHRCTSLDETVVLALTQPVSFIRMIPLVGG